MSNGFRPHHHTTFPIADGTYGSHESPGLSLLVLGDSIAASLGTSTVDETLGAQCAAALSRATGRPVRLRVLARPGATTGIMKYQVRKALRHPHPPGIALIIVGSNDIVAGTPPPARCEDPRPPRHATPPGRLACPGRNLLDVGHVPAVRHWVAAPPSSRRSRRLEHLQTTAAQQAGAVAIPLRDPRHRTHPELFAVDRIHPSAHGHALHLQALTGALARTTVILSDRP
ncbi:hypothetical protein SBADM41S_01802 [Streptomyces badius]